MAFDAAMALLRARRCNQCMCFLPKCFSGKPGCNLELELSPAKLAGAGVFFTGGTVFVVHLDSCFGNLAFFCPETRLSLRARS